MNVIMRYREAFTFYTLAAVVLTAVAIGTDGHAQDGTPPQPRPRPSSSATPTFTSTPTPIPTVSSMPTVPPVTLLPSSPPPSVIVAASTPMPTLTPTPSAVPTPTPMPTPSPTATPHNKAKGLKDGCLVQKKKWLLQVPCPPAHKNEVTP